MRINISIPDQVLEIIDLYAYKKGMSRSEFFRFCVEVYLDRRRGDDSVEDIKKEREEKLVDNTKQVEEVFSDKRELQCPFCRKKDNYETRVFDEGGYNCKHCKKWVSLD